MHRCITCMHIAYTLRTRCDEKIPGLTSKMSNAAIRIRVVDGSVANVDWRRGAKAGDLLLAACRDAGLSNASAKHFALAREREPRRPARVYADDDEIDVADVDCLVLRKWIPIDTISIERKLANRDDVALRLLFHEARDDVERGKLRPSDDQIAELESYCDPAFPVQKQYLFLCHELNGYATIELTRCRLAEPVVLDADDRRRLEKGLRVKLTVAKTGLEISRDFDDVGERLLFVVWQRIRRWRTSTDDGETFGYEVRLGSGNFVWVLLETDQAFYVCTVVQTITGQLKKEFDGPESFLARPLGESSSSSKSFRNQLFSGVGKDCDFSEI